MYVRNHMLAKDKLTTVSLDETIGSALEKINQGKFLSLPVFEGNEFKGIIMKEAIYRHYFDQVSKDKTAFLNDLVVGDLYSNIYESIGENERIERASYLLKKLSTPFLAVIDSNNKFVGILTHVAIFNAFSEIFGFEFGSRIVVNMFDIPGQLARLTEILRRENANILNFTVVDAKILDIMRVILRVETDDLTGLIEKIQAAGFKIGEFSK